MTHKLLAMAGTLVFLMLAVSSCSSWRDSPGPASVQSDAGQPATSNEAFGGQPKDQAARERHHPQYPESAQHLGPQEDQATASDSAQMGNDQSEQERAAISGIGR